MLEDPDPDVRLDARAHLVRMGNRPVLHLRWVFENRGPDARYEAVIAMQLIGNWGGVYPKDAVPELTRQLEEPDPKLRARAAEELSCVCYTLGDYMKARAILMTARADLDADVRQAVELALSVQAGRFAGHCRMLASGHWTNLREIFR
jgi:hypothetical protein